MLTPQPAGLPWRTIPITLLDLCVNTTLPAGQSFRWQRIDDTWFCALQGRVVSLKQSPASLQYQVTWPVTGRKVETGCEQADDTEKLLRHYFSLDFDLESMYQQWAQVDPVFRKTLPCKGVRVLSQDAWETLVCFICSSNNNIPRITHMVRKLCEGWGSYIAQVGDCAVYDFPSPETLQQPGTESRLRGLGFGYRAAYIAATARMIQEKPTNWLDGLRNPKHPSFQSTFSVNPDATLQAAREQLMSLSGVGPKVADCVCLMGLSWSHAVPVDTHILSIARRKYSVQIPKSLTKAKHHEIASFFQDLWGEFAGWAQAILFTSDLKRLTETPALKEVMTETVGEIQIAHDFVDMPSMALKYEPAVTGQQDLRAKVKTEAHYHVLETEGTLERHTIHVGREVRGQKGAANLITELRAKLELVDPMMATTEVVGKTVVVKTEELTNSAESSGSCKPGHRRIEKIGNEVSLEEAEEEEDRRARVKKKRKRRPP